MMIIRTTDDPNGKLYCRHRLTIVKRWSEGTKQAQSLCMILKCRYCDHWERRDIDLSQDITSKRVKAIKRAVLIERDQDSPTQEEGQERPIESDRSDGNDRSDREREAME